MQTRTFLFADLREYTRFVEHHGDAAAATLIGDYRRLMRAEVARHGGAEVKTEGDSFYVVFDSATAALTCAMAILREADRYSLERSDRPMRVGVGVHAGEPRAHEGQFVGEAVIVAARLAQEAKAGELLVTEVVRGLVGRAEVPAPVERTDLALKGLVAPPRVYAVDWHLPEPPPALAKQPPASVPGRPLESGIVAAHELIDRSTETAALEALWVEAGNGWGRLVLIGGDAGLGKTALVRHFLSGRDGLVMVAECTEIGSGRPFGPFIDALLTTGGLPGLERFGPGAQAVAEADRHVIHAAIIGALRARSAARPVALVLEDIHWADPSTLELLEQLPRQITRSRILALATYRTDEATGTRLGQALARIERTRLATNMRLRPLDEDGTARLVMSALGLDRAPTRDFRVAIHERCEGNPFFTEEVLRTLVERGQIRYEDGRWLRDRSIDDIELPRTIRAAVELRLRELLPTTIEVVRVAAVVGARFDFAILTEVGGFAEGALVAALADAVEAQLVVEDRERPGETYRFRHALTREVVLAGILTRERQRLHRAIAEAIERRAGGTTSAHAEDLAYHFDHAGVFDRAVLYLVQASEHAMRSGAWRSVREHLERAIKLAPADHPDLDRIHLKLSRVAYLGADHRFAEEAARAALRIATSRGRPLMEGAAETAIARVAYATGRDAERDVALERALALLEPLGPTVELADASTVQLSIAWFERWPDAVEIGRRCLALTEQLGWTWGKVRALNMLGLAIYYTGEEGQQGEALGILREGLALSRKNEFVDITERAITNLHEALTHYGAPADEVRPLRREAVEHAARYGYRSEEEWHLAFDEGSWDQALEFIEEHAGVSLFAARRALMAAVIHAFREGPSAGLAAAERPCGQLLAARAPQWTNAVTSRGVIRYLAGDLSGAIAEARLGLGLPPEVFMEDALVAAIAAAVELRDENALATLVERAAFQLHRVRLGVSGDARTAAFPVAFSAYARGVTAERRGDAPAALAEYQLSATAAELWGRAFTATQARLARARILRDGELAAARAEVDRILPFWRKAKASWYLAQLAQTQARLGTERVS